MSRQRVLVLGAEGFLGRRLMQTLEGAFAAPHRAKLQAALASSDAVVNAVQGSPAKIAGTAAALYDLTALLPGLPRIVHVSSMTVYGAAEGIVDENDTLRADLGEYSSAQLAAERRAAAYANCVILRPGCEYGPACPDWSERIARLLIARRLGDLGAAGDGLCNLIYIDDLADAVAAALRLPDVAGQAFNLAMPSPPTWNEYFGRFARALGAVPLKRISHRRLRLETQVFAAPLRVGQILARRTGLRESLMPTAISPSLVRTCCQEIHLNSCKAQEILGLEWTPLTLGLQRAAAAAGGGPHPA